MGVKEDREVFLACLYIETSVSTAPTDVSKPQSGMIYQRQSERQSSMTIADACWHSPCFHGPPGRQMASPKSNSSGEARS